MFLKFGLLKTKEIISYKDLAKNSFFQFDRSISIATSVGDYLFSIHKGKESRQKIPC
jgi:hypothetical protein